MEADAPIRLTSHGMSYRVDPGAAEVVAREIVPDLDGLSSRPGVGLVKRNNVRTVLRVPVGDDVYFVKRYHVRGPREWVKYLFVPSRAVAEWRAARAMREAGLPTVEAVLMGENRLAGVVLLDGCFATREIPGGRDFVPYLASHFGGVRREELRRDHLDRLARLIRRFHDLGFAHGDLHSGNILVTGKPEDSRIHLLDLHSVKIRSRIGRRTRIRNLSKLLHSLTSVTNRPDRLRLIRAYQGDAPALGDTRSALRVILDRIDALERRRVRSRTKRCLRRSSSFDLARSGRYRLWFRREVPDWAPLLAVGDHLLTMERGGHGVLKDSRRSGISRQLLATSGEFCRVVVKETRVAEPLDVLKNAFRTPRAKASWINGNGLVVRKVGAARPLALVVEGGWPFRRRGWLFMEDLGGFERLDLFALGRYAGRLSPERREEKREVVKAFGRFVGRLHRQGIYHGDLKAVNVFVRLGDDGDPEFNLIDYDRVVFSGSVRVRRRVKNLAQLAASVAVLVTKTDRLRFFRAYAWDPEVARGVLPYGRGVERECRKKIVVRMAPIE